MITEKALRIIIDEKIKTCGSQAAAAREIGITCAYFNDYIHGRRKAGNKILKAFGLKKIIMYEFKG